jgi:hypothetical protein
MRITNRFSTQLAILVFGVAVVSILLPAQTPPSSSQPNDAPPERFWIAGRYDASRVIVYFDAVKFEDTLSTNSEELAPPVAGGFFRPVRVPESFAVRFQKGPSAEHFALGDKYDLLLDGGVVKTVTLTTLVGAETDEGIGNDSFLGAVATLSKDDIGFQFMTKDYYVLRRHHESATNGHDKLSPVQTAYAYLEDSSVRFNIQTQIADLLTQRMQTLATEAARRAIDRVSPYIEVKAFHLPDGSLRYYASAEWNPGMQATDDNSYSIAAWLSPKPTLHIIGIEPRTFGYQGDEPKLLNVIDLGGGKTGVIFFISAGESIETDLLEYRDGAVLKDMRMLQSIAFGE